MIAVNLLCAKAKKAILNISPAGCGKAGAWLHCPSLFPINLTRRSPIESVATDTTAAILGERAKKYTSLTLAGLKNISEELNQFGGHIVIDDLGSEKRRHRECEACLAKHSCTLPVFSQSEWSRTSTVTVLANLVHTHYARKVTQGYVLEITNFYGSAGLNIQPVLLDSIIGGSDWVAVVRDKVLRYYHLIRPLKPKGYLKPPEKAVLRRCLITLVRIITVTANRITAVLSSGNRFEHTNKRSNTKKEQR